MKPVDRRKALRQLRRLCKEHGINLVENPGKGQGSHGSWIFSDADGTETVRIIVVYEKDISPVVQRSIIQNLTKRTLSEVISEGTHDLVRTVLDLIGDLFGS